MIACAFVGLVEAALTQRDLRPDEGAPALFYGSLQQGRYGAAAEILEQMRGAVGRDAIKASALLVMEARYALERQRWDEAMALPEPPAPSPEEHTLWFAKGVAAARASWPGGAGETAALAREAGRRLDAIADREGRFSAAEVERLAVLAAIAAAQEEREEMKVLLTQALSLDDRFANLATLPVPIIPVRELAGDLWVQVGRFADAQREYAIAVRRYPGRARTLLGVARASVRIDDHVTARRAYTDFLAQWKDADPDRPELAEARRYLAERAAPRGA